MIKSSLNLFLVLILTQANSQINLEKVNSNDRPFILGKTDLIQSTILNESRTLNIYLPEGYSVDSAQTYPVIYLLDGSADEDFIHIAGLVQFCNFEWVNSLPKSIIVGISNVDRKRDFTFPTTIEPDKIDYPTTGGSEKFIDFIAKELQPYIDKNYKTNSSKMLVGQSLGGLLATEILFKKNNLFSQYIIVSPSLWWDNGSLFQYTPTKFETNISIHVSVGKEEKQMIQQAKQLAKELMKLKSEKAKIAFEYLDDKNHGTILHQAVYNAFMWFSLQKVN